MRPTLLDVFSQVQPVHGTWHVNIRKENLHVVGARFKNRQRNIGIGSLKDMKPGILQVVGCRHAYKRLILDKQNNREAM